MDGRYLDLDPGANRTWVMANGAPYSHRSPIGSILLSAPGDMGSNPAVFRISGVHSYLPCASSKKVTSGVNTSYPD